MKLEILYKGFCFGDERPFNMCHASTITALPDGSIMTAWFGGTHEKNPDVAIWGARLENGTWSRPFLLSEHKDIPQWNPVFLLDDQGMLFLFYKVGHSIAEWATWIISSEDNGKTWTQPCELVPGDKGGRGPVKNKPILTHNKCWLAPASLEFSVWDCFVDISCDRGKTWHRSDFVPLDHSHFHGRGIIQPTLWESEPGKVHMLTRSTAGISYRSDSPDGGKTWCPAYPSTLPNNNSGIDVASFKDGKLFVVYNPVGVNLGPRSPLNLAVSDDNGITWQDILVLEAAPGEYAYPAIISSGNRIFLSYTWKRERIAVWILEVTE